MKNIFKALKLPIFSLLFLASFIACDKDFSVIESDVLGEGNTNFLTDSLELPIAAYNKKLEALQTNNLPSNLLGVFNDPAFGLTTASIVTQVTPTRFPVATSTTKFFGEAPVIDSVVLSIPYFSRATGIDVDGNSTYTLDSIYGNSDVEIKLSVYQNNYFLKDFNGNGPQNYYSNASSDENSVSNGSSIINFDEHIVQLLHEENFKPSANATVITSGTGDDKVETRSVPALRFVLENNDFWKTTIIDKGEDDDSEISSTKFNNYFRGLYFKAESISGNGSMFLMNLASTNANITIHYTSGETDDRTQSTYVLNLSGNKLNTFINDYSITLPNGDKDLGDEKLYLKGTEGSMAIIDLFGTEDLDDNMVPDRLDDFLMEYRQTDDTTGEFIIDDTTGEFISKRLINEAHLEVYEDESMPTNPIDENGNAYHKYDRIYAYDVKNNTPLADSEIDPTTNTSDALNSKIFSLGQRDDSGKYIVRITEHLNNIIKNGSTNYQIGLVLSTNVNVTTNSEISNSTGDDVTGIPSASIISPRGTILHGSNTIDVDKRLKLKIFFTKPKEN